MAVTYRISELAADLAVTTRTIRFYEEQGLISPSRRGHERIYTPQERHLLRIALTGKQLGLPLAECRELLELFQADDPAMADEQLQQQIERVSHYQQFLSEQKRAIATLATTLSDIKTRCQQLSGTRSADSEKSSPRVALSATSPDTATFQDAHRIVPAAVAEETTQTPVASKPKRNVQESERSRTAQGDSAEAKQEERHTRIDQHEPRTPVAAAPAPVRKQPKPPASVSPIAHDDVSISASVPRPTAKNEELDLFSALEEDSRETDTHRDDKADNVAVDDDGQFSFLL